MATQVSASGEPSIDGSIDLKRPEFEAMVRRLKTGELPQVSVQLRRVIPSIDVIDSFTVPVGEVCRNVRNSLATEVTASQAIGRIVGEMQSYIAKAKAQESIFTLIEKTLLLCVQTNISQPLRQVSELGQLRVRLLSPSFDKILKIRKSEMSEAQGHASATIEWLAGEK